MNEFMYSIGSKIFRIIDYIIFGVRSKSTPKPNKTFINVNHKELSRNLDSNWDRKTIDILLEDMRYGVGGG